MDGILFFWDRITRLPPIELNLYCYEIYLREYYAIILPACHYIIYYPQAQDKPLDNSITVKTSPLKISDHTMTNFYELPLGSILCAPYSTLLGER